MKLAIAQSNLTLKGGAERILLKIAQHYKAPIYVAEYNNEDTFPEFLDMDIRVIKNNGISSKLPYGRISQGLNYGLAFYNLSLGDEFDVINAHMAPSHWVRNKNERVLWYCHTPLRDIYDLYHYRMSLRKLHMRPIYMTGAAAVKSIDQGVVKKIRYIVANSNNIKTRIEKYYKRDDAAVLGGAVDFKKFSNQGDDKYFFYPSRISPNKRQDYALEAFRIFSSHVRGYKLIIAGAVSKDKFYYDYYRQMVEMGEKMGKVVFMTAPPTDSGIIDLYSRSTAVLYPPVNEDYGLVPLEAMASSKPIIAINEGGPKETIKQNKTGMLVSTPAEMARAMEKIAKNSELAARMGKAGRKYVEKEHSWEKFFKEFDRYVKLTAKI